MKKFWNHLKTAPWFRRGVRTFFQAFLALLVPGLLGFLNDLTQWANTQGQSPFPDAENFSFVVINALLAGVIAVVTALWTKVEDVSGHSLLRTLPASKPGD